MNIELKAAVTCDQTSNRIEITQNNFTPTPRLTGYIKEILKLGWTVCSWRNADGDYATYTIGPDGWRLMETRTDGRVREAGKRGFNREFLWITAPGVVSNPPFTESAHAEIERRAQYTEGVVPNPRVKALESQVAYLTAQIERMNTTAVAS